MGVHFDPPPSAADVESKAGDFTKVVVRDCLSPLTDAELANAPTVTEGEIRAAMEQGERDWLAMRDAGSGMPGRYR